ncbi:hypothetical protein [[Flexibacter] sp. ATCC 35208]|uniref:hypothetical protein n=1 Tax=[Flexibacter] sp. ATCC 35208 TaxID=1936242 RepID=UPI0009D15DD8|nr:hypothetical protein [[Flexibacter] sp. ATCC 35208]OMP76178.1 hypothetical protein BW716_26220 [[Flexibacter] sp. ATCC 35208]
MKKTIAVIDAVNYKEEQLIAITNILNMVENDLTILMIEDTANINSLLTTGGIEAFAGKYYDVLYKSEKEKQQLIQDNTTKLKKTCEEKNIPCTIKNIMGIAADSVILESRFADLLIIGRELSFPVIYDGNPTVFVKNILTQAQCPIIVLPDIPPSVIGVACCYNGTYSSMYAIRAFAAIFPHLIEKNCEIVYEYEHNNQKIPYESQLQEYLKSYKAHSRQIILSGAVGHTLQSYLHSRPELISTFGAYGRNGISRFFNHSSAENIIRKLNGAIFITHPGEHI